MNDTDKKLYELLGDNTLSFGCVVKITDYWYWTPFSSFSKVSGLWKSTNDYVPNWISLIPYWTIEPTSASDAKIEWRNDCIWWQIINHEPTSTDLFKWMMDNDSAYATLWLWDDCLIFYGEGIGRERVKIPFDLSKKLIDQSEETKLSLINLIESYARE